MFAGGSRSPRRRWAKAGAGGGRCGCADEAEGRLCGPGCGAGGGWRRLALSIGPDLAGLFAETRNSPSVCPRRRSKRWRFAYHQPVTRAEIEDIRGVTLSRGSMELLLELGWIRPRGRRRTPGRPLTFGTTDAFLSQFGLASLDALPGKDDLRAWGFWTRVRRARSRCRAPAKNSLRTKKRCQRVTTQQAFSWIIWARTVKPACKGKRPSRPQME